MSNKPPNSGFAPIDQHFANLLCRKGASGELFPIFAQLSQTMLKQNSCLIIDNPDTVAALRAENCVTVVSSDNEVELEHLQTPLVLVTTDDNARLFTQRYYAYETRIAREMISRNQPAELGEDGANALREFLSPKDDPLQVIAAVQSCLRQLSIITGGPGTGKTSTVVKILAGLLKANPELRLKMAAPTGKAAMRLSDSVKGAAARLKIKVPTDVSTLHRLLGVRGDGRTYQYHQNNPIPLDVLILDEASMIDLVMFDRLLSALPKTTRLILLGDPRQLPSVESGNVLADLTAQGMIYSKAVLEAIGHFIEQPLPFSASAHIGNHVMANTHCALRTSYRFSDDAAIGQLAKALLEGDQNLIEASAQGEEVTLIEEFSQEDVVTAMGHLYADFLAAAKSSQGAELLLELFERARLLTPVKEGEFGVNQLNEAFESQYFPDTDHYYHGKPIMIERNHYALRLFNGDVGICVQHGSRLEVAFKTSDGSIEYFLPSRLPQHDSCFAMTVHKSQGSEFNQVCLVLPETQQEEFMSRELIYTGVTRCRDHLQIFTSEKLGQTKPHQRITGLKRLLAEDKNAAPITRDAAPKAQKKERKEKPDEPDESDPDGQLDLF